MLHGSSYVTQELDVCLVLSPEITAKLRVALGDLNPVHWLAPTKLSFLDYHLVVQSPDDLHLETESGRVNVFDRVLGIGDYRAVARNAVEIPLFGRRCRVISLEDLIKAKEARGRDKDLLTAKELRAIAVKRKGC